MTQRWNLLVLAAALAAVLVAFVAFFLRPRIDPPPPVDAEVTGVPEGAPTGPTGVAPSEDIVAGGFYEGTVVDAQDGSPVRDADVLLVGDSGPKTLVVESPAFAEPLEIPQIGDVDTVARTKTDAQGWFRLAGGSAKVWAILAWGRGYAPALRAHHAAAPLRPGREHVLRLDRGGRLVGHVVDAVTKAPVAGAEVSVYLQTRANQGSPGPEPFTPSNQYPRWQRWVAHELGPIVWGIAPKAGDSALPLRTKPDGSFELGPLMKEVQVDVIVTHPDYVWEDFDPEVKFEGEKYSRKQKIVVKPGETVERTYALSKGREVRGIVVDEKGTPLSDVEVHLEHVAQYAQHHWYRTRARTAKTASDGSFRVAGLSYPPFNLRMTHPAFDTEWFPGVQESAADAAPTRYRIAAGGWISGRILEGPAGKRSFALDVWIQPASGKGSTRHAQVYARDDRPVPEGGAELPPPQANGPWRFDVDKVKAGTYLVWASSQTLVAPPVQVEVETGRGAEFSLSLQAGGALELAVRDRAGRAVDPVTVDLEIVLADGSVRRHSPLLARAGVARATSLLPGRYRARVRAPDHVGVTTDAFDVGVGAAVVLPPVVLARQAWIQLTGMRDAEGKAIAVEVRLQVSQDGGPAVPVRPLEAGRIPVGAGRVTLTAVASDGRKDEQVLDLEEAATVPVEIVLK